jgi:hypothetical protein
VTVGEGRAPQAGTRRAAVYLGMSERLSCRVMYIYIPAILRGYEKMGYACPSEYHLESDRSS